MKKMIMWWVLSCFFVFAILTSAVPFSALASNSSDDVMGNVLDSLNEVDPHEDVVVSGVDNVTYEAGRNLNDSNITGNASNRSNDLEKSYLFSWDSVPGGDNEKRIRSFRDDFDIDWAEKAEIRKSNDGMTINISKDENSNDTQGSVASWDSSNDTGATILPEVLAPIQQKAAPPLWGLYAGVSNVGGPYGPYGAVYHYDGTEWSLISTATNLDNAYAVLCLVEYGGDLYAGTRSTCGANSEGRVYRYDGIGIGWARVGSSLDNQVCSLAVYNGKLYAGSADLVSPAMKLYEWNGANWENRVNRGGYWRGARSLYVWDGYLYIGNHRDDRIGRYNDISTSFEVVFVPYPYYGSCIYDFELYQGDLYGSCYEAGLAKSSDGVSWSYAIPPNPLGKGHMWELENFQYHLYMGFEDGYLDILGPLGTDSITIWTAPHGIISMTTDRLSQQLFIGIGGEAGYYCRLAGDGLVYMSDGAGAPHLISYRLGNGVQVLYWCHHEGYDQLKSFEDLLESQAAALKSFENLLKAQWDDLSPDERAQLLESFEELLKQQAAELESFEDLLIVYWDELPPDVRTVLLKSFEDLLMSQAEAIWSFEELMKKLPVLPPSPSEEPIGVPVKPQSSPPESQSPSEMLFSAIGQQYDTNNNDKIDREGLGKAARDCIAKEITREEFREITSSYFQGL